MLLSLLFIVLLRFLAGVMVWVMVTMLILVLGYGTPPPQVCKTPLLSDLTVAVRNLVLSHLYFIWPICEDVHLSIVYGSSTWKRLWCLSMGCELNHSLPGGTWIWILSTSDSILK